MKIIGLTGGIGSGKSRVLELFKKLGVPVYISDVEAKKIMHTSKDVIEKVIDLFGNNAYVDSFLNSVFIADIVFNNKEKLKLLNAIVHPAVHKDFQDFVSKQNAPYLVYESAVLFENKNEKICTLIVLVIAPEAVRIERVLKRETTTIAQVKSRINNQLSDDEKISKSDFVISNIEFEETKNEVLRIHQLLLKKQ
jgi:dephospho-CoA kinase